MSAGHLQQCPSSRFTAGAVGVLELEPVRRAQMHGARSSPRTHRGARVIGTDALRILVISQKPSDGEERNQDNEDNPNIDAHQSRLLPSVCTGRYTQAKGKAPGTGSEASRS